MRSLSFLVSALTVLESLSGLVFAQVTKVPYDPSPLLTTGFITGATLNNASDILSGGTLTLLGDIEIVIPRNLLVNTPSLTAVAWSEMFTPDGTINLPLWPEVTWEANVYANYIQGQLVAGIVYIFQELANLNEGFITHIDYDKGEMRINGDFSDPTTGTRLVINDPVGRYGKVHGDWPLWTADTDNPSIVASTGYPVCIPRVDPAVGDDPLCPKKNRPLDSNGVAITEFTFAAPPVPDGQPDPNLFAPLVVGDFIIYSATLVADPDDSTQRIYAVYTIEANLGFYTAPGTIPAYIRIETSQDGINGNPAGEIQETRVEGYTTDQTATIEIFAMDVDPCTGEETERSWGTAIPRLQARQGQWRFRSSDPALSPYTREVGTRIAKGTVTTPNGIIAGQLISPQPFDGWLFPELLVFGANQLPLEFNLIPYIAQGSGPWLGGIPGVPQTATGPIVGQLDPWPGVTQPARIVCPVVDPSLPVADAGADFNVATGTLVTLVGVNKNDLVTSNLTFNWTQISGPSVELTAGVNGTATFTAPSISAVTALVFSLTVSNAEGSSTDKVMIDILPNAVDHITLVQVSWKSGKGSGTLTVIATTDSLDALLFVSATNPDITTIPMTDQGDGRWQALVSMRPAPASVTVTSNLGGFASTDTVTRRDVSVL